MFRTKSCKTGKFLRPIRKNVINKCVSLDEDDIHFDFINDNGVINAC